tara:strand:- start:74 stop:2590 length:2517 start_codon:yes stop_codon:yes gene_type:complete
MADASIALKARAFIEKSRSGFKCSFCLIGSAGLYVVLSVIALGLLLSIGDQVRSDLVLLSADELAGETPSQRRPCGIAVPDMNDLSYGVGLKPYPMVTGIEDLPEVFVREVRSSFCDADHVYDALSRVYRGLHGPGTNVSADNDHEMTALLCEHSALYGDKAWTLSGEAYTDPRDRLRRAYLRSNPAFVHYWPRSHISLQPCLFDNHPFPRVASACPSQALVHDELRAAALLANGDFNLSPLTGDTELPTEAQMLFRLLALAAIAYEDRTDNAGLCFGNTEDKTPVQLCQDIYDDAIVHATLSPSPPTPASPPGLVASPPPSPPGVPPIAFAGTPGEFGFYYTSPDEAKCPEAGDDDPWRLKTPPPPPPTPGTLAHGVWEGGTVYNNHLQHCIRTHEFSASDLDQLYGLPDFQNSGAIYIRGVTGGIVGDAVNTLLRVVALPWFYDQRIDSVLSSPYREAMLASLFRVSISMVWVIGVLACAAYWLGRGAVVGGTIVLTIVTKRFLGDDDAEWRSSRPSTSIVHGLAIALTLLMTMYVRFIDPYGTTLYERPTECTQYLNARNGGSVFDTNREMRYQAYIGIIVLAILGGWAILDATILRIFQGAPTQRKSAVASTFAPIGAVLVLVTIATYAWALIHSTQLWLGDIQDTTLNSNTGDNRLSLKGKAITEQIQGVMIITAFLSFSTAVLSTRWMVEDKAALTQLCWLGIGAAPAALAFVTVLGTQWDAAFAADVDWVDPVRLSVVVSLVADAFFGLVVLYAWYDLRNVEFDEEVKEIEEATGLDEDDAKELLAAGGLEAIDDAQSDEDSQFLWRARPLRLRPQARPGRALRLPQLYFK